MLESLEQTITQFRLGMEAGANHSMISFIDSFLAAFKSGKFSAEVQEVQPLLQEILSAQERGDYLFAADLLEYQIAPIIRR